MAPARDRGLSRDEKKELLRKRNAERDARKAGGVGAFALLDLEKFDNPPIYELKDGYNYIDNLPYEVTTENHPDQIPIGEDDYKLEVWAHRNVGPNNEWIICLKRTFNKKCRCCEERDWLQTKEGGSYTTNDKEVKALTPTLRCFYNVIDVSDDAKTDDIQLFENAGANKPSKWFEALLNDEAKAGRDEPIPWYDLEDGMTIKVRAETDKFEGNEFVKPTRIDFEDREPYDEEIYDEVYPLDAMLKIPTYEDQCKLFELGQSKDTDNEDEDGAKSSRRGSRTGSSNRSRSRSRSRSSTPESKETSEKTNRSRRRNKTNADDGDDGGDNGEDDTKSSSRSRRSRNKGSDDKKLKQSGRSRGRGRQKTDDDDEEKEKDLNEDEDVLGTCPYDFTFGADHNQKDACVECDDDIWDSCSEASKMIKNEKNKEKGGRRRSTTKGRR